MKKIITLIHIVLLNIVYVIAQPGVTLQPFASGFNSGISDIAHAGDNRLFIAEQLGYISIVDEFGVVLPGYFLDLSEKVTPTSVANAGEQGLLGLAFSPDYANDGFFYVNYTNKTGVGNTIIARYQVSSNPNVADPASEEILLNIHQPYGNHNGGSLKFGADGYLYCALGDGGSFGDPQNRAQNTDSILGKILRIDVSSSQGYTIPATNPFASGGGAPEVWAYGLRNPWKISFDRLTNNLWIGDVGQSAWEEINFQSASSTGGENYGWRCYEGNAPYNTNGCAASGTYDAPVHVYSHSSTGGCSVTGGYVYRGSEFPDLTGYYFFSDYCNGIIYYLSPTFNSGSAGSFNGNYFSTFGENVDGELFIGSQSNGNVYKVISTTTSVEYLQAGFTSVNIYPTPNNGLFTCELNLLDGLNATFIISDLAGRECYKVEKSLEKGHNNVEIDLNTTSSGYYILNITTNEGSINKNFEILK